MLKNRIAVAVLVVLLLPGCFFRKNKLAAPKFPPVPLRIVVLPLNIPQGNVDLRWLSLAHMVLAAKELEDARDLEVVPFWEGLPAVTEALGPSRSISPEVAADAAIRVNARWAMQGEISPSGEGISLLIDFIPRKASDIPFRYQKEVRIESLSSHLRDAFEQFLRYLVARPLTERKRTGLALDSTRLKEIAEAIDKEYGWFAPREAGRAQKAFASLVTGDGRLARLLFNPALYSASGAPGATQQVAPPSAQTPAPQAAPPEPGRVETPPTAAPQRPAPEPAPQAATKTLPTPPVPSSPVEARPQATKGQTLSQPAPRSGTYFLQVLSTRNKVEAEKRAQKLSKAGYPAEVSEADLQDKGVWYRVRVQGFETREAAQQAAKKLVADGLITEYWISP